MTRRRCPAARLLAAELHRDKMQAWYDATHSQSALFELRRAVTAALALGRAAR